MTRDPHDPRLTAFVLGELDPEERADVEDMLAESAECRQAVEEIRLTVGWLTTQLKHESESQAPAQPAELNHRAFVEGRPQPAGVATSWLRKSRLGFVGIAASLLLVAGSAAFLAIERGRIGPIRGQRQAAGPSAGAFKAVVSGPPNVVRPGPAAPVVASGGPARFAPAIAAAEGASQNGLRQRRLDLTPARGAVRLTVNGQPDGAEAPAATPPASELDADQAVGQALPVVQSAPAPGARAPIQRSRLALNGQRAGAGGRRGGPHVNQAMDGGINQALVFGAENGQNAMSQAISQRQPSAPARPAITAQAQDPTPQFPQAGVKAKGNQGNQDNQRRAQQVAGKALALTVDNAFQDTRNDARSTVSIDGASASDSDIRRLLDQNVLPPKDAVRIEDMLNDFPDRDAPPTNSGDDPFVVHAEVAGCPWTAANRLARIGIAARPVDPLHRPVRSLASLNEVKVEADFNPARVARFRLIGSGNRMTARRDSNGDARQGREIGAGHHVTVVYELVPVQQRVILAQADRNRNNRFASAATAGAEATLIVELRYKKPGENTTRSIERRVTDHNLDFDHASDDLRFAAAVAGFGMLLRDSPYKGSLSYDGVLEIARRCVQSDPSGRRREFVQLVGKARALSAGRVP